jgi:hypothetical protein
MKIGLITVVISCIPFAPAGGYTLPQQSFFVSTVNESVVLRPTATMSLQRAITPLPEVDSREDIHIYTASKKSL